MKKFQKLLINCIDEEIKGTTVERLTKVKAIFESEMLWNNTKRDMFTIQKRLEDWLQGLCSAVSIPFENHIIIEWYEKELGREAKGCNESFEWLDKYWPQCARTLYNLLYI